MSDIFEEVEEEVRKDKLGEVWRRYGWIVWLSALAIVGFVAFSEWRSAQLESQNRARVAELDSALTALEAGNFGEAQSQLQAIVDADTSLSPIAANLLAQARLVGGGDKVGAAQALESVATSEGDAYRQLALLKSVYLRAETMTLAEMETELGSLTDTGSQLGALAEELIAAKAFAEGDFARARREYNRLLIAANAPAGLQQRARIALDAIPRSTSGAEGTPSPEVEAPAEVEAPTSEEPQ
ncbi:MAG: tetratricopeptide repeat protein [Pseudomonadota bacterium]